MSNHGYQPTRIKTDSTIIRKCPWHRWAATPWHTTNQKQGHVMYGWIMCYIHPSKVEPNRTQLKVGGKRIHYCGDCSTPTADLLTVQIMLNSVISTKGAKFMTIDIKNFYLNTPMTRLEYLGLHMGNIPDHVQTQYYLQNKAHPRWLCPCWNMKTHVWSTAGRMISTRPPGNMHQTTWLLSKQSHPRIMASHKIKHQILSCRQWFWGKIHWQKRRRTPW